MKILFALIIPLHTYSVSSTEADISFHNTLIPIAIVALTGLAILLSIWSIEHNAKIEKKRLNDMRKRGGFGWEDENN